MILIRTPYRISFFGGGTDYRSWYERFGGDVLSTTINQYNYLTCRYSSPFDIEFRNRISWRINENTTRIEDIQHNAVREALLYHEVKRGIEIIHQSDLPARSGLASSSSFCAGLLKAIYTLKGEMITKYGLARETIRLEREILKEQGGIQDQIAVVYGGLNYIHINYNGSFSVEPIIISEERKELLNSHLLLFFTGLSRNSFEIAQKQVENITVKEKQLARMQQMVFEACEILNSDNDIKLFGELLDETWQLKRSLATDISNNFIDNIYTVAKENGAIGGKILGAGGGGFILLFADPEKHKNIKQVLHKLIYVPFKFDEQGCQTLFYAPKEYDKAVYEKRDFLFSQHELGNIIL